MPPIHRRSLLIAILLTPLPPATRAGGVAAPRRPDIQLIVADDHGMTGRVGAADAAVTRVVEYDGARVPAGPAWAARGAPTAAVTPDVHLRDESDAKDGGYRAAWAADPDLEVMVEATLKLSKTS